MTDKHSIEVVNETELASMLVAMETRFDPDTLKILRDPRFIFTQTRGDHRAMRLIAIFGRSFFCGAPGVLRGERHSGKVEEFLDSWRRDGPQRG